MPNLRTLLILVSIAVSPALAKPSDWADVVDPQPNKRIPYDASRRVDRAPIKSARAEPAPPSKTAKASKADKRATKAKAKAGKAKARKTKAKAKRGRR